MSSVVDVYANSDILLLTSSSETGPIVAWEAMAEGLALVTSDYLGRSREGSLQDGLNCRLFPIGDIKSAVDCLRDMQDRDAREKIAAKGRELVLRRYSLESSIDQWANCLEQICALPSRPKHDLQTNMESHGRLDRFLGVDMAESIRRLLGREYVHSEPGGEWPHSYGDRRLDDPEFWRMAQQLDAQGEVG